MTEKKLEYFRYYRKTHRESVRKYSRNSMRKARGGLKNHGYLLFNVETNETIKVRTINEGASLIGCCNRTFRKLLDSEYKWRNWLGERII